MPIFALLLCGNAAKSARQPLKSGVLLKLKTKYQHEKGVL